MCGRGAPGEAPVGRFRRGQGAGAGEEGHWARPPDLVAAVAVRSAPGPER